MSDTTAPQATRLAGLRKAQAKQKALREQGIKIELLGPYEKHLRDPKSLRKAITAKCWDCVGADADPNPRGQIRDCIMDDCPLWTVRPWQRTPRQSTPEGDE